MIASMIRLAVPLLFIVPVPALQETGHSLSKEELELALEFSPLPDPPGDPTNAVYESEAAARFGQALFFDRRLSGTGETSCATCHDPGLSWTDGKQTASAVSVLTRHTMTLWNVAYNRWFFWDGRKDTLWSQALGPLEDPREHAGSRMQYAHLIAEDSDYRRAYTRIFGPLPDFSDPLRFPREGRPVADEPNHPHKLSWTSMTGFDREKVNRVFANLGKSIAAFERKLISRWAPFDTFVQGLRENDPEKLKAISPEAQRGFGLFVGKGRCFLCHNGPNFTDLEFHNSRVPGGEGEGALDLGRFLGVQKVREDEFNGIGRYSDEPLGHARDKVAYLIRNIHSRGEFKTPTLRNVARTAPYMHNGQFATLQEVLRFYSTLKGALPRHKGGEKLLIPVNLTTDEEADLIAFLETLTDESLPEALLSSPEKPYMED